jgi:hypothetical protein
MTVQAGSVERRATVFCPILIGQVCVYTQKILYHIDVTFSFEINKILDYFFGYFLNLNWLFQEPYSYLKRIPAIFIYLVFVGAMFDQVLYDVKIVSSAC